MRQNNDLASLMDIFFKHPLPALESAAENPELGH
jgi:hypothetical protein